MNTTKTKPRRSMQRPVLRLEITNEEVICHSSSWSEDGKTVEARVIIHATDETGKLWEANKVIKCRFRKSHNNDYATGVAYPDRK